MKNQNTAAETYAARIAEMRANLKHLSDWLDQVAPKPEDANWENIGDLGHANSQLEALNAFLSRDNY